MATVLLLLELGYKYFGAGAVGLLLWLSCDLGEHALYAIVEGFRW